MQNPETPPVVPALPLGDGSLADWFRTRTPPVPSTFMPYLLEAGGGVPGGGDLTSLGLLALSRALVEPGRDRDGAFYLLSADAFLTYACEVVAEGEGDVRVGLESILERVGGVFR